VLRAHFPHYGNLLDIPAVNDFCFDALMCRSLHDRLRQSHVGIQEENGNESMADVFQGVGSCRLASLLIYINERWDGEAQTLEACSDTHDSSHNDRLDPEHFVNFSIGDTSSSVFAFRIQALITFPDC
jgi:hypothetical protein